MKKFRLSIFLLLFGALSFTACDDEIIEEPEDGDEYLIKEALFNSSSLVSIETITSTLEDGTSAECFQITFSSNPVENGPYCPTTINDVAGMGFYDGATNPGL